MTKHIESLKNQNNVIESVPTGQLKVTTEIMEELTAKQRAAKKRSDETEENWFQTFKLQADTYQERFDKILNQMLSEQENLRHLLEILSAALALTKQQLKQL